MFTRVPHKNQIGFALIEVLVASAIMMTVVLAATSFFEQQIKFTNFIDFRSKRDQLRSAVIGQVLNDPNNCKCLFASAPTFPVGGTPLLVPSPAPTAIGPYNFGTPGDCSTATLATALASTAGVDSVKMTKVEVHDVVPAGSAYSGTLYLSLQSTKDVSGPSTLQLQIPISISTSASGGNRHFDSCSMSASTGGGNLCAMCTWNNYVAPSPYTECGGNYPVLRGVISTRGSGDWAGDWRLGEFCSGSITYHSRNSGRRDLPILCCSQ